MKRAAQQNHPISMMTLVLGSARLAPQPAELPRPNISGGPRMILAADYPFLDVLWTMLIFFLWVSWFMLLFHAIGDVFRRRDIGGGTKTLWLIFMLFLPFLGVFVYLIANSDGIAERNAKQMAAAGSSGAAAEIEQAKRLLESGTISQQEFDAIKAKALA
jgi:uncharacterized membrane protein